MTNILLLAVLLVSILALALAVRNVRSSRRSEALGEDRYELLRDNWNRLELLREERRMLREELDRQAHERQQLMEFVGKTPPQLVEDLNKERGAHLEAQERIEDLKQQRLRLEQELHRLREELERERQEHLESQQRAERLEREQKEQSDVQQEVGRLGQERQRLTEDLEREREERLVAQRRVEQQEHERARLEGEVRRLKAQLDNHRRAPTREGVRESQASHPWRRRPILVVGLLFGALIAWLTSLMVALYLVSP
jgi:chromosome segregation ATPase